MPLERLTEELLGTPLLSRLRQSGRTTQKGGIR